MPFLFLLITKIGFPQSYELARVMHIDSPIHTLEIDDAASKLYISSKSGPWVYDFKTNLKHQLRIKLKDSPEFRYYRHNYDEKKIAAESYSSWTQTSFSKNGDYLVYFRLQHQYPYIYVYKRKNRRYRLDDIISNVAVPNSVAINDDFILAVGSGNGTIRLWDLKTKSFIRQMKPKISTGYVGAIRFSDLDQNKIVIGNGGGESIVIDIRTDSVYNTWKYGMYPVPNTESLMGQSVRELFFTENDSVAAISLRNPLFYSLNLWNVYSNEVYQIPLDTLQPISIDKSDQGIFIGGVDGNVYLLKGKEYQLKALLPSPQVGLAKINVTKSGAYLVTADSSGIIKVWVQNEDIRPGK